MEEKKFIYCGVRMNIHIPQYSALLRLPRELCLGEKMAKVEEILKELNLKECANTRMYRLVVA